MNGSTGPWHPGDASNAKGSTRGFNLNSSMQAEYGLMRNESKGSSHFGQQPLDKR